MYCAGWALVAYIVRPQRSLFRLSGWAVIVALVVEIGTLHAGSQCLAPNSARALRRVWVKGTVLCLCVLLVLVLVLVVYCVLWCRVFGCGLRVSVELAAWW
jgi:hypothetical protein